MDGVTTSDGMRVLREYGLSFDEVKDPGTHNRKLLVELAARSIMAWQTDMMRLRPVQPPPSRAGSGTNVFFVDGSAEHGALAIGTFVHHADTATKISL